MKPKRIKRLVDIQERVHRAKQGYLAQANQSLRSAQQEQERVRARKDAHSESLSVVREWEVEGLPQAAQFVALSKVEMEVAEEAVSEQQALVQAAADDVREAGYELRRYEMLSDRARAIAKRLRNRREQAATDDIAGQRWRRNDD